MHWPRLSVQAERRDAGNAMPPFLTICATILPNFPRGEKREDQGVYVTTIPQDLAVLFADVCGSTTLYEKLGDKAALKALDVVVDLLRQVVGTSRGRVIKTTGDGLLAVFVEPDAAVTAAGLMQARISALPPFGDIRLSIRIGLHAGPVIESEGDCYGDVVNIAARMTTLANGGQIITTRSTAGALSPPVRQLVRDMAALPVRGKRAEIEVCEVLWRTGDEITMLPSKSAQHAVESVLRITHGAETLTMDADTPVVQIGRDAGNHIVVPDRMASRLHGRIERRGGKYYFADLSTNGSYIAQEGDAETLLRREEVMLRGRGTICCGHSATELGATVVMFALDHRVRTQ